MSAERCRRCGTADNPPWSAPSPLWNAVMRGGSIKGDPIHDDLVCIPCFQALASEMFPDLVWRLTVEAMPQGLEMVTPSGRVWNAARSLWDEPTLQP